MFISVIPLAAEDNMLAWLDRRFIQINKNEAWSAWLQLLRLVYNPGTQEVKQNADPNNSADSLIDVEIFDDTEPNIFDEPIYTASKCFRFMLKNMKNCTSLEATTKEKVIAEYSILNEL